MSGHLDFEMRWGPGRPRPRASDSGGALDVVVVAELGGETGTLRRVDAETFDDVFARIGPRVDLAGAGEDGGTVSYAPSAYGGFHADRLLEGVPALAALRRLAGAAADPAMFAEGSRVQAPGASEPPDSEGALLERLMGARPPAAGPRGASPLDAFIRGIVTPHLTPGPTPRQREVQDAIASATAGRLRDVLRQKDFRRLEAAWTGVRRLAFRLEADGAVRLHVVGTTGEALVADASAAGADGVPPKLRGILERAVADGSLGGRGLLVFDVDVAATTAHVALAARLGALARATGMPALAAADASLLGASSAAALEDPADWTSLPDDVARLWQALRASELAPWIGLAAPRVLARPPYGARIEPVEGLEFEEVGDDPGHDGFTWMSGAFAVAEVAASSAAEGDPEPLATAGRTIDDLPFVAYSVSDGRKLQPAAEAVLSDRAADAVLAAGIMPLRAVPARASVAIPRLQSIADPAARLGG